jgi:hypothetical protein
MVSFNHILYRYKQRSATLQNIALLHSYRLCRVLILINFSSYNGSNLDRAITLRRDNGSYIPKAITFRNEIGEFENKEKQ